MFRPKIEKTQFSLWQVHALGPQNVLHKYEPFLLNLPICTLLYLLTAIIVTMSSCVLYMYGYQKFMAFVETESQKHRYFPSTHYYSVSNKRHVRLINFLVKGTPCRPYSMHVAY